MHLAVEGGHTQVAALLIKNGFNVNQCTDSLDHTAGLTPLMLVFQSFWGKLYNSSAALVDLLIINKADLNIESPNKESALFMAVKYHFSFEITRNLIDAKAEYKVKDKLGNNLLHASVDGGKNSFGSGQAHSERSVARLIKFLIKSKVDLHAKNLAGDSPLHYAILKDFPIAIELLVKHRADIMQLDGNGKTAIQKAESQGKTEIAKFLAIEYEKRRAVSAESAAVVEAEDRQKHLAPTS